MHPTLLRAACLCRPATALIGMSMSLLWMPGCATTPASECCPADAVDQLAVWSNDSAAQALPLAPPGVPSLRSRPLAGSGNLTNAVAVLAVASADGEAGINRNLLAIELADLIRERHAVPVLSNARVRDALGASAHASLQQHLASIGQLDHRDRQRLMAARLPVPVALTLRVTDNRVVPGQTEIEPLRDDQGRPVPGAERVVLSTLRRARVAVEMLDLRTGIVYWRRDYEAMPAQRRGYNRFRGRTLGQSVAAEIATRLANGLGEPDAPPPPSLQLTLRALLVKVVDDLPLAKAPG